jgi:hypothetical protein
MIENQTFRQRLYAYYAARPQKSRPVEAKAAGYTAAGRQGSESRWPIMKAGGLVFALNSAESLQLQVFVE